MQICLLCFDKAHRKNKKTQKQKQNRIWPAWIFNAAAKESTQKLGRAKSLSAHSDRLQLITLSTWCSHWSLDSPVQDGSVPSWPRPLAPLATPPRKTHANLCWQCLAGKTDTEIRMEIARGQIDIPSAKQEWEIKIGSLPLRHFSIRFQTQLSWLPKICYNLKHVNT